MDWKEYRLKEVVGIHYKFSLKRNKGKVDS